MHSKAAIPGPALALLVEDDPVTREFLCEVLLGASWEVESARNVAEAVVMGRRRVPSLLLCDLRLPDGDAFDVARSLWLEGSRASARPALAVALSAELDGEMRARLHRAGFGVVLTKPVSLSDLLGSIGGASTTARPPAGPRPAAPVLDDAAALAVCGDMRTVESLRELLAIELPAALDAIRAADKSGDAAPVLGALHRLRSASGFCGAAALSAALGQAGREGSRGDPTPRDVANVLAHAEALLLRLANRGGR